MRRHFLPAEPDEAFVINGVPVTGRQLAEARQQRAHEGSALDRWHELSGHDQEIAALAADNYLKALATLVPAGDRLLALIRDLADPDPCWFDHHGGCQAHGYLSLGPGEKCPHAEAKEILGGMAGHA